MEKVETFLSLFSIWSVVLPLVSGVVLFNYLESRSKIIWWITVCATVPQMVTFFYRDENIQALFYNTYSVFEFLLIQYFFYTLIAKKKQRRIIYINCFLFAVYFGILIYQNGIGNRFINEIVCLDNVLYTNLALIIIYDEFDEDTTTVQLQRPDFYFLLAILIYAPVTVFVFSTWHFIQKSTSSFALIVQITNDISNSLLYVFFTFGIVKSFSLNRASNNRLKVSFNTTKYGHQNI